MKTLSLLILGIYMVFFLNNTFEGKNKIDVISSFVLFLATCIPFFYIANG